MAPKRAVRQSGGAASTTSASPFPSPAAVPSPSPSPDMPEMAQLPAYIAMDANRLRDTQAYRDYETNGANIAARRSSEEWNVFFDTMHDPDDGVFVNIGEIPAGLGHWDWMEDDVDEIHAQQTGFNDQAEVELGRQHGVFGQGPGPNAGPMTIWYPDRQYFNPEKQPDGFGHWAYHTTQDRGEANTNFAGSVRYGLAGNQHPAAREIWRIRQEFEHGQLETEDDIDPTLNINLVWIPGEADPEAPDYGVDEHIGETHEPTNAGENDQTGDGSARYQTRMIDGKKFTVNRQRAHAKLREPSKSYIVTKKGEWQQYGKYSNIDWSSDRSVETMNKWREQAFTRNGWPLKRPPADINQRAPYTDEERNWVMDQVKETGGKNPTCGFHKLTRRFNKKFPRHPRDVTGISSLVERLKKEYARFGGSNPDRKKRGENLKRLAKDKKRKREAEKQRQQELDETSGEETGGEETNGAEEPAAKKPKKED